LNTKKERKTEIEIIMPGIFCSKIIGIPKPSKDDLQVLKKYCAPVAQGCYDKVPVDDGDSSDSDSK
jgi:hypothetical protein